MSRTCISSLRCAIKRLSVTAPARKLAGQDDQSRCSMTNQYSASARGKRQALQLHELQQVPARFRYYEQLVNSVEISLNGRYLFSVPNGAFRDFLPGVATVLGI